MKQELKRSKYANIYLHILGYLVCIIPPLACAISYFPIWEAGGLRLHALCAVVVILAFFPAIRLIKRLLASDATYVMWLILFILFFALSRIADKMSVISLVGFISNSVGAVLIRIGGKRDERKGE